VLLIKTTDNAKMKAFYFKSYDGQDASKNGDLPDPVAGRGQLLIEVQRMMIWQRISGRTKLQDIILRIGSAYFQKETYFIKYAFKTR